MTKEELEKLPALQRRLTQLNNQIHKAHASGYPVSDVVRGKEAVGGKGKTITIKGIGHDRLPEWEAEYYKKAEEYLRRVTELEVWIDSLPEDTPDDIDIKTILQYKYRNGLKHWEIAGLMGYSKTAVTTKLKKFWEKQKCDQSDQISDV